MKFTKDYIEDQGLRVVVQQNGEEPRHLLMVNSVDLSTRVVEFLTVNLPEEKDFVENDPFDPVEVENLGEDELFSTELIFPDRIIIYDSDFNVVADSEKLLP